ncbi:hypothetical protein [Microbispora sp. CA-102843]|uniref:hypothetical protein n=1 Tax=Microbispora sp. CA-102843 TaxID=3239952 RepID=UPI003D8E20EF
MPLWVNGRGRTRGSPPAGTLLFATHGLAGLSPRHDFDPGDYYQPGDIAGLLDHDWTVLVNETRPRRSVLQGGQQ